MATKDGVYQLDNGLWAYRFSILIDGKRISRKKSTDEFGNKLLTQAAAAKARMAAITAAHIEVKMQNKIVRRTYQDVYDEYSAVGRKDRAYATIQKQELLWNSRIKEKFGKRYVDDVSVGEVLDFLSWLYYDLGYSYSYVEGFLKMFYLIIGQAYSRNYLDIRTSTIVLSAMLASLLFSIVILIVLSYSIFFLLCRVLILCFS